MKKFVRAIAIMLLICTLYCAFVACNEGNASDTNDTTTVPDVTTQPGGDTEVNELVLADKGVTDFKVIRTDDTLEFYSHTVSAFRTKLSELLGVEFGIDTDFINPRNPVSADAPEILVGVTNREETIAAQADLPESGYLIRATEHKLVIVSTSKLCLIDALNEFVYEILQDPQYNKDGRVAFPVGFEVKKECDKAFDFATEINAGKTVRGDIEQLFHYKRPDVNTNSQGAATDGEYVYTIMKRNMGGNETGHVVKVDMKTWEVVAKGPELPLNHANDMTYDSRGKRLVVTNMYDNLITIIDPVTLDMVEQKKLEFGTYGVAYNEETNRFVFLAYGGKAGIVETDENFNFTKQVVAACDSAAGYTGQGMDCDSRYIYVPLSPGDIKQNKVQVYDWSGNFLGNVVIDVTLEIETMMHFGDKFYANFNNNGSKIFSLDFYVPFE